MHQRRFQEFGAAGEEELDDIGECPPGVSLRKVWFELERALQISFGTVRIILLQTIATLEETIVGVPILRRLPARLVGSTGQDPSRCGGGYGPRYLILYCKD